MFTPPPVQIPANATQVTFRLTSNNWPSGTGDMLNFSADRSPDQQTWTFLDNGTIAEGALSRSGEMPKAVYKVAATNAPIKPLDWVRVNLAITPQGAVMRLGLEWEVL